jgi:hypothetical protein
MSFDGAATATTDHATPPPLEFSDDQIHIELAKFDRPAVTRAQAQQFTKFNLEVAKFVERSNMKKKDAEAMLHLFRQLIPGLHASVDDCAVHLKHSIFAPPIENFEIDGVTVAHFAPLPVLQALLCEMVQDGLDLALALAPEACEPDLVPVSVRQSEMYHSSIAYLNCGVCGALPLLFDVVVDSWSRAQKVSLWLCLTADRARKREICIFTNRDGAVDVVLKRLIRPAVVALETGVLMHVDERGAPVLVVGSLCGVLGTTAHRSRALALQPQSSVLSAAPRHEWFSRALTCTATVRSLPAMAAAACAIVGDDNEKTEQAVAWLESSMQVNTELPLPELLHPTFKLLHSSIFRIAALHQHVALFRLVIDDMCALLSSSQLQEINDILSTVQWPTLDLPPHVFNEACAGGVALLPQQWRDLFVALPDVLMCADAGEDSENLTKCLKLALALRTFVDRLDLVRAGARVPRALWREQTKFAWVEFLNSWHTARDRPLTQRADGDAFVAMPQWLVDASLSVDLVCHTGPLHVFPTHHPQQHDKIGALEPGAPRKRKSNDGVALVVTDAPIEPIPQWLLDLGVLKASASPALQLGEHFAECGAFVHILLRDGEHLWGSIHRIVAIHEQRDREPRADQRCVTSGSSWLLELKEFDLVRVPRTRECFVLTRSPTQLIDQTVRVLESEIEVLEHVLTVTVGERRALLARAQPIRAELKLN